MKLIFGLNILLRLKVYDPAVDFEDIQYIDVHGIKYTDPKVLAGYDANMEMYSIINGKRIDFADFNELYRMDKRKLLSYGTIYIRLS